MNKPFTGEKVGKELIDALGLPEMTRGFTLRCFVGEVVTVECEYYAGNAPALVRALASFIVVHRTEEAPADGVAPAPYHFDTWMRERTNAAHAAYMAQHAEGGKSYGERFLVNVTVSRPIHRVMQQVSEAIMRSLHRVQ